MNNHLYISPNIFMFQPPFHPQISIDHQMAQRGVRERIETGLTDAAYTTGFTPLGLMFLLQRTCG